MAGNKKTKVYYLNGDPGADFRAVRDDEGCLAIFLDTGDSLIASNPFSRNEALGLIDFLQNHLPEPD